MQLCTKFQLCSLKNERVIRVFDDDADDADDDDDGNGRIGLTIWDFRDENLIKRPANRKYHGDDFFYR